MMGGPWISIIAMIGWLILALGALRAHRVDAKKGLVMALMWGAIFLLAVAVFGGIMG